MLEVMLKDVQHKRALNAEKQSLGNIGDDMPREWPLRQCVQSLRNRPNREILLGEKELDGFIYYSTAAVQNHGVAPK